MDFVSIIVPFYNAEKYLNRCIESILRQSVRSFELLLVNDCSTDSGPGICRAYEKRDERIRCIEMAKNSGVSGARNKGMEYARSDYIVFIDSDDWIEERFLELLLREAEETDADLICCSHINKTGQGEDIFHTCEEEGLITSREAILGLFRNRYVQPAVWGKLFKRDIICRHSLQFDSDITMSEDIKFVFEYLSFCSNCCLIAAPLYWYVVDNPESAMNSGKVQPVFKKKWLSAWTAYERMGDHAKTYFNEDSEVERVFLCSQTNTARMKLHLILKFHYKDRGLYREFLSFIRKHVLLFLKYDYSSLSRKLMIVICAVSPKLEFALWKYIRSGEL